MTAKERNSVNARESVAYSFVKVVLESDELVLQVAHFDAEIVSLLRRRL